MYIVLRASIDEKIYGMIKENSMGRLWDELEDELLKNVLGNGVVRHSVVDRLSTHMKRSKSAIRSRIKLLRGTKRLECRRATTPDEVEIIRAAAISHPDLNGYRIAKLIGMSDRTSLVTYYVKRIRRSNEKVWVSIRPEEILEV